MKVVITVTAVYDLPDDVEIEEIVDEDLSYGEHIVFNGHKLQPVIEFLEYEGKTDDTHGWGEPQVDIDEVYDSIQSEEYTLISLDEEEE
ncbi:MAG: hypothetical protein LBB56_03795 [Chitinispirillales bacterium]|jgi:hypothetical protein|nr:hypothetical protein [Chitinispirillales bacterium]